jgi:hypothetical protein
MVHRQDSVREAALALKIEVGIGLTRSLDERIHGFVGDGREACLRRRLRFVLLDKHVRELQWRKPPMVFAAEGSLRSIHGPPAFPSPLGDVLPATPVLADVVAHVSIGRTFSDNAHGSGEASEVVAR